MSCRCRAWNRAGAPGPIRPSSMGLRRSSECGKMSMTYERSTQRTGAPPGFQKRGVSVWMNFPFLCQDAPGAAIAGLYAFRKALPPGRVLSTFRPGNARLVEGLSSLPSYCARGASPSGQARGSKVRFPVRRRLPVGAWEGIASPSAPILYQGIGAIMPSYRLPDGPAAEPGWALRSPGPGDHAAGQAAASESPRALPSTPAYQGRDRESLTERRSTSRDSARGGTHRKWKESLQTQLDPLAVCHSSSHLHECTPRPIVLSTAARPTVMPVCDSHERCDRPRRQTHRTSVAKFLTGSIVPVAGARVLSNQIARPVSKDGVELTLQSAAL